jgi:hypothetical protein
MSQVFDLADGALTMGYLVSSLFFLKFWRRIGDRLFLVFAAAFAVLAVNQAAPIVLHVPDDSRAAFYVLRLLAFGLIIWGLLRNHMRRPRT